MCVFVTTFVILTCTTVQVYSRPLALMETSLDGFSVIKGYFDEVSPYRRTEEKRFVTTETADREADTAKTDLPVGNH